nr:transposase [Aeromonas caviae]
MHDEALRREINEGLNVVEQWNGATPRRAGSGTGR